MNKLKDGNNILFDIKDKTLIEFVIRTLICLNATKGVQRVMSSFKCNSY